MKNQSVDFWVRHTLATRTLLYSALALAFVLGSATVALAQQTNATPQSGVYGTTSSPAFDPSLLSKAAVLPSPIFPEGGTWTGATYATGGASLRNRKTANISVSGASGVVQKAFLYWAVITTVPAPANLNKMLFRNVTNAALGPVITLTGNDVGSGPNPCWFAPPGEIIVYRADITAYVNSPTVAPFGGGSYQVTPVHAGGNIDSSDPWVATPVSPLWEGASIVVIGTGTGSVELYDVGFAGVTFTPFYSYTLQLTLANTAAAPKLWDNIGADGQIGASRTAAVGTSSEMTTINGVPTAGTPGLTPLLSDSDWDGSSGWPLPQLWDDTGHDIALSFTATTTTLFVQISGSEVLLSTGSDCLTTVANVIRH